MTPRHPRPASRTRFSVGFILVLAGLTEKNALAQDPNATVKPAPIGSVEAKPPALTDAKADAATQSPETAQAPSVGVEMAGERVSPRDAGATPNADATVKRAEALEKLGRDEEALAGYNRAIALDNTLVIAHLHKGGLLNRLRRYDEALNCYEQALLGQGKKSGGKIS